ncbi:hypothetical protein Tco_1363154 [Tanacetum coccineum]
MGCYFIIHSGGLSGSYTVLAGKENGVNILKSIDEGPFQMGTFRETLVEGNEGALHLGLERARVYSDLSPKDKERFVTTVKLNRGLKESNYDQLYAYLKQHEAHANENKMMWERFTQHTIDPLALMSNVSPRQYSSQSSTTPPSTHVPLGRQNRGQGNNPRGTGAAGNRGAQNKVGNANSSQARQIKCYNCNGGQDNVVDEDVDEQSVHDLALNVDNVFQVDDYLVYDEASPSYDSDILSEVPDRDNYQDAVCEHHEVHEMHDDVQPNYVADSHADYTSDSNMIPYDQYVKDNAVPVVQSNVSSVPNDAYMMILNDMHEQSAQYVFVTTHNNVVDKSLTAELATYKEQVELYERRATGLVISVGEWWWWRNASGGAWYSGSVRSGYEEYIWSWPEYPPENFSGGGGMVATACQTDAQRAALWHAISDVQRENRDLRLQLAEERRARLELAEVVDGIRRGQEPRGGA